MLVMLLTLLETLLTLFTLFTLFVVVVGLGVAGFVATTGKLVSGVVGGVVGVLMGMAVVLPPATKGKSVSTGGVAGFTGLAGRLGNTPDLLLL